MTKYIDAERLRAEIDKIEEEARKVRVSGTDKEAISADGKVKLCLKLKSIINSLQQEQPNDLASLISEATNVAKRIIDKDSFYNSLPQNIRDKYTSKAWCEILEALSTIKIQEQPEVDLEKETIIDYVHNHYYYDKDFDGYGHSNLRPVFTREDLVELVRHFFNLGLNAKK